MEVAQLNLSASAVAASQSQTPGLVYPGFLMRAGARLIDLFLHFALSITVGLFVGIVVAVIGAATGGDTTAMLERMGRDSFLARVLGVFGFVLYFAICEGLFGSTAGKYLLGLVVLSDDGRPASYTQAVGRSFAFLIDGLFLGLVGYLKMKDSPTRQRFGDVWADTVVVTRASAPPETLRKPIRFVGVLALALIVDAIAVGAAVLA